MILHDIPKFIKSLRNEEKLFLPLAAFCHQKNLETMSNNVKDGYLWEYKSYDFAHL